MLLDFNGNDEAIATIVSSPIKVFAQNIETVERLTHPIRILVQAIRRH